MDKPRINTLEELVQHWQANKADYERKRETIKANMRKDADMVEREVTASAESRLMKLVNEGKEFRQRFETWAAGQAQFIACVMHGIKCKIDLNASLEASKVKKQNTIVYENCPTCMNERLGPEGWLLRSGVPQELFHATLDNWNPRTEKDHAALKDVRTFAKRRIGFLVLLSKNRGNGKSHLAVGVLKQFRTGLFITQQELLDKVRNRYDDKRAENIVKRCKEVALLIIDEIGVSVGGKDEEPTLHTIMDHRHGNFKPTILTSNLLPGAFSNAVGERMTDRLRQSAFKVVTLDGESMRKTKRAEYFKQKNISNDQAEQTPE